MTQGLTDFGTIGGYQRKGARKSKSASKSSSIKRTVSWVHLAAVSAEINAASFVVNEEQDTVAVMKRAYDRAIGRVPVAAAESENRVAQHLIVKMNAVYNMATGRK